MKKVVLTTVFLFCLMSPARSDTLNIAPIRQEMPHWCWAAVSEMVFQYYGIAAINPNDYQCAIVSLNYPACLANCSACNFKAPDIEMFRNVLTNYPHYVRNLTGSSGPGISVGPITSRLSMANIRAEIDAGRPVVAGISPSGFSIDGQPQHVALIVGYEADDSKFMLIVNDPFPYEQSPFSKLANPYIAGGATLINPGQYRIDYSDFRNALQWTQSIYNVRCNGAMCP